MNKITKKILFLIIIFIISNNLKGQSITWRKIFGGPYNDIAYNCIQSKYGGYLMIGFKQFAQNGTNNIFSKSCLVKLDEYGNVLWEKIIGDSSTNNVSNTIIEDSSGNIFLPYYSDYAHLVKLDSKGNLIWDKDYTQNNIEWIGGINFVENYGKIIVLSLNIVNGFRTASISKMDTSGNIIFNKSYFDSLSIFGTYTCGGYYFLNNSYYICGFSQPALGIGSRIGLIIKTDTSGNLIWNKKYSSNKGFYSIAQNSDNNFIASGQAESSGYLYCQKFDYNGNTIWNKNYRYDTLAGSIGFTKIIKNFENNFALGTPSGHNFGRLMIIDSLGAILTSKFYYYPSGFYISQYNLNNTSDSGYIVSGSLDSNIFSNKLKTSGDKQIDILLFKIDKYGKTVGIINNTEEPINDFFFNTYPNPFNSNFKIKFNISQKSDIQIILFDITGKIVYKIESTFISPGVNQLNINIPDLSSGVYFLRFKVKGNFLIKKIFLIK